MFRSIMFLLSLSCLLTTHPSAGEGTSPKYPPLEVPITSFGGAISGDFVYVYGGATGTAHSYSVKSQSDQLLRLNLKKPKRWETVAKGPRLQGLALVSHQGVLYRLGGFTAKNAEGEKHDLHSQDSTAKFDPKKGQWEEFPPLPEPRSSFNAAVLGDWLYVVGGWQLRGQEESQWHSTGWRIQLTAKKPKWEALPQPPFHRRALAVAAFDGKIYAIGGMQKNNKPCTKVDIYNPKTRKWEQGPAIQGEPLEGFGCAAFANKGQLYVSTLKGNLQRLNKDGKAWSIARKLPTERFFHQMLPMDSGEFLMVGGASMLTGKHDEIEVVPPQEKGE